MVRKAMGRRGQNRGTQLVTLISTMLVDSIAIINNLQYIKPYDVNESISLITRKLRFDKTMHLSFCLLLMHFSANPYQFEQHEARITGNISKGNTGQKQIIMKKNTARPLPYFKKIYIKCILYT